MKYCFMLLFCVAACNAGQRSETAGQQAIILHQSMMQKAGMIDNRLHQLRQDSTVNPDSLNRLAALLAAWKADVVEVPGADDDGHHHKHTHEASLELTAQQMLDIQTTLDERLGHIGKRLSALKTDTIHETHQH